MAQPNSRLEAFSDGIFAFAITLLVIDIKVPAIVRVSGNTDLWYALKNVIPSVLSFLLSFIVILITWVNHHNHLKLLDKSSNAFLYANGFLMLSVVVLPFPTSFLGEYLFSGHAAPAMTLYDAVLSFQALGWVLISQTALTGKLGKNEKANREIRQHGRFGYFAFTLYALCSITATWFPLVIASFTGFTWIFWLIFGIRFRHEE